MERLNLSTYAKEIKSDYDKVVTGELSYAVYTTLSDSSLKPTAPGTGDINDFVSEFEEGSVQFGVVSISPHGSDVRKILLLGWCPDSAPLKSKISFASNVAEVGKTLHYHVQVNARDSDDLDVDDLLKTVSNASGARYSIQSLSQKSSSSSGFKPTPKPASPKPVSTPTPKPSVTVPAPTPAKKPVAVASKEDEDEWDGEEEVKEIDFRETPLSTLPSAYKKTTVDIESLRKGKSDTTSSEPVITKKPADDSLKNELPEASFKNKMSAYVSLNSNNGRSTSLPNPKATNVVSSKYQEVVQPSFGTKAPLFGAIPKKDTSHLVGGLSKNFGADHGKTPAQIWAEKKGKFTDVAKDEKPVNSAPQDEEEEVHVDDVKAKFESLNVKEEEEAPKPVSSFPPPPVRRNITPPAAATAAPVVNKFKEEEDEEPEDDDWKEEEGEEAPASAPPQPLRSLPLPSAPVFESKEEEERPVLAPPAAKGKEESITAVAEYDYEKDEDNEISFTEGETITKIKFVDEDWWFGFNPAGESGLFPASYVTVSKEEDEKETAPAPASAPASEPASKTGPSAVAEYDYAASEDNELTFKEGDLITDIEMIDEDWWLGSFKGARKLFPSNFVTLQE